MKIAVKSGLGKRPSRWDSGTVIHISQMVIRNPLLVVSGVVIIPRHTKHQDRGGLEGGKESMGTLNDMMVVVTIRIVDSASCGQQF